MDLKQIKQIIDLMKRAELTEFTVEEEGFKLKIKRGENGLPVVTNTRASTPPFTPATPGTDSTSTSLQSPASAAAQTNTSPQSATTPPAFPTTEDEIGFAYIKSPMVGTFYRSSSPENKPFVETGDKIENTSVVCIIEAMKIMNEIQAETKGTIAEILIESGQPVEYGQRLFKIKTA